MSSASTHQCNNKNQPHPLCTMWRGVVEGTKDPHFCWRNCPIGVLESIGHEGMLDCPSIVKWANSIGWGERKLIEVDWPIGRCFRLMDAIGDRLDWGKKAALWAQIASSRGSLRNWARRIAQQARQASMCGRPTEHQVRFGWRARDRCCGGAGAHEAHAQGKSSKRARKQVDCMQNRFMLRAGMHMWGSSRTTVGWHEQ